MTTPQKSRLRDMMPETAKFLDDFKAEFGKLEIETAIREGQRGKPTFWASENGREVGTRAQGVGVIPVIWTVSEAPKKTANPKARR